MNSYRTEDVIRIRDCRLFKQWQLRNHEIKTQIKRLGASDPANNLECKRILQIFARNGIVAAVKHIRETKNLGLAESVEWMREHRMWVDSFGNWKENPWFEPLERKTK